MQTPEIINDPVSQSSLSWLSDWGDEYEKEYSAFVLEELPSYEKFWQVFTLPFRREGSILIRLDLPQAHEAIYIYHYSIFRAALRANSFRLEAIKSYRMRGEVGSNLFYDVCIWITIVYERFEQLFGSLYFYLFRSDDKGNRGLKTWDRHQDLLNDFMGTNVIKCMKASADHVKAYRNFIAHGPKFPGAHDRVPKEVELQSLLYWSAWAKAVEGPESEWRGRTIERADLIECFWAQFARLANEAWERVLMQLKAKFGTSRLPDHHLARLPSKV